MSVGFSFMTKLIIKWFFITLGGIVLVLSCFAFFKVAFYHQTDNQKHNVLKGKYLEKIAKTSQAVDGPKGPNVILILFDDMGYGDISAFGSSAISTPNIDAVASEGAMLTQYYAPAPVCTPSRVATLTGRYAPRAGLSQVVFPEGHFMSDFQKLQGKNIRLPAEEITIAETLKSAGYATGMVGKWHVGDLSPSLPNDMGFEYFFGAHYSNDMPEFSLYRNRELIDKHPIDQTTLTSRYTDEAVSFIKQHKNESFFLYLPHNFPHVPLFTSKQQSGKSKAGLYGDVVADLDDNVGAIIAALKEHQLDDNTLVIITSDNGPWWQGSPGGLRGRKADTFDGGMRVPFIAWWPGKIPEQKVIQGLASGVDILPTILDLAHLPLPEDRIIDGLSLKSMLLNNKPSPHKTLYYYSGDELFAMRSKRFKYHISRPIVHPTAWQMPFNIAMRQDPWLFDLDNDFDESYDVSNKYPQILKQMKIQLDNKNTEMQKNPRGWID